MFAIPTLTHYQSLQTPAGSLNDSGKIFTASAVEGGNCHLIVRQVHATGGGANAVVEAFPATGFQAAVLLADVPVVITLTGATVINGVTIGTVTLEANVEFLISSITGAVTAISVAASSGAVAGWVNIVVLYNNA